MESKNAIWAMFAVALVAVFLFAAFASAQNSERAARAAASSGGGPDYLNMDVPADFKPSGPSQPDAPAQAQTGSEKTFTLGLGANGYYSPAQITVDLGDTVTIEGDMSQLRGCTRAIVIPAFGVAKTLSASDNIISFVASKKGTFPFSCSMGMVRGTLVVQ
jgi:plastocyanin